MRFSLLCLVVMLAACAPTGDEVTVTIHSHHYEITVEVERYGSYSSRVDDRQGVPEGAYDVEHRIEDLSYQPLGIDCDPATVGTGVFERTGYRCNYYEYRIDEWRRVSEHALTDETIGGAGRIADLPKPNPEIDGCAELTLGCERFGETEVRLWVAFTDHDQPNDLKICVLSHDAWLAYEVGKSVTVTAPDWQRNSSMICDAMQRAV